MKYRWKIYLANSLLSAWRFPPLMSIKKKDHPKEAAEALPPDFAGGRSAPDLVQ
jgi:hypothetical protein